MKKWIIGTLAAALCLYLLTPTFLHLAGYKTTRVMVYNGTTAAANFTLNGKALELAPGAAEVYRSSRLTNRLRYVESTDEPRLTFGPGQHFVNLGDARLRLLERYYRWEEDQNAFFPYAVDQPRDRLLYDAVLGKGLYTLDTCWDCLLLLPPNDRPYRYLTPENKDRRIFVSSRM